MIVLTDSLVSEKCVFFLSEGSIFFPACIFYSFFGKDYTSLTQSYSEPGEEYSSEKNTIFLLTHSILDKNVINVIFAMK